MNKEERIILSDLLFPDVKLGVLDYANLYPKRNLKDGAMVTRMGPSPTGFVHLGNLFGAFIDKSFARQSGGVFYLRIEDTDSKRAVLDGVSNIINDLESFGFTPDEGETYGGEYGPYKQSSRNDIYHAFIKHLLVEGLCYPCFMTSEEISAIREEQEINKGKIGVYGHYAVDRDLSLEEVKAKLDSGLEWVIRIRANIKNLESVTFTDCVLGDITFPVNDIDHVLLKKDKTPVYHFAHVIDDYLMGTTHVIRGGEWLSSTPLHLQLFDYFNLDAPKYCHHATLNKKDNGVVRKLSKRHDPEVKVSYYKELGIPIDAVHLYLATLMNTNFEEWYLANPSKGIEDFEFSFAKMSSSGALFDLDKLTNICKTYFAYKTGEEVFLEGLEYYKKYDSEYALLMEENKDVLIGLMNVEKNTARVRKDIAKYSDIKLEYYYGIDSLFDEYAFKDLDKEYNTDLLLEYINCINLDCSNEEWFASTKEFAVNNGYASSPKEYKNSPDEFIGHVGDFCEGVRVMCVGKKQSPDLFSIMKVLGKDVILDRVNKYINR